METDDKDLTLLLLEELQKRIGLTATALTLTEVGEGNNTKAIDELNARLDRLNQLADTCKALAEEK